MPATPAGASLTTVTSEEDEMPTTKSVTTAAPGDLVIVSGHRVGESEQIGEVIEVLGGVERTHFRVRWGDGRESLFFPGSDTTIRPKGRGGSG